MDLDDDERAMVRAMLDGAWAAARGMPLGSCPFDPRRRVRDDVLRVHWVVGYRHTRDGAPLVVEPVVDMWVDWLVRDLRRPRSSGTEG